ncbi:hypothetical protein HYPSUDRAFT_196463 [Hypholoma sublateritium FD-334 SS-4]|uniref:Uncharacterized protein n=1 Tax=Hypholoma sublateritium (strain FD-334 SS-4) TaxID=945553 RepID=A0A0D2QFA3_HYPSF|nr:hypothetical protein HYPSUDRAFT_196463 [Hypholoma sublateritium FD-334 SS-4]
MSYRKPVPVYIPTPPPSPRETDGPGKSLSIEKEIPPLPSEVEESLRTRSSETPSIAFDSAQEGQISSNRVEGVEKDVPPLPRNSTEVSRDLSGELPPLPKEEVNITDSSGRIEKDIPPLPDNWREIVAQNYHEEAVVSKDLPKVLSEKNSIDDTPKIKHRNQLGVPQPVVTSESKSFLSPSPNSHGHGNSYVTLPGSQTSRGRGLPRVSILKLFLSK